MPPVAMASGRAPEAGAFIQRPAKPKPMISPQSYGTRPNPNSNHTLNGLRFSRRQVNMMPDRCHSAPTGAMEIPTMRLISTSSARRYVQLCLQNLSFRTIVPMWSFCFPRLANPPLSTSM
nr:MAG TPA: hypothetical protein [Caudoviricetes sp.]